MACPRWIVSAVDAVSSRERGPRGSDRPRVGARTSVRGRRRARIGGTRIGRGWRPGVRGTCVDRGRRTGVARPGGSGIHRAGIAARTRVGDRTRIDHRTIGHRTVEQRYPRIKATGNARLETREVVGAHAAQAHQPGHALTCPDTAISRTANRGVGAAQPEPANRRAQRDPQPTDRQSIRPPPAYPGPVVPQARSHAKRVPVAKHKPRFFAFAIAPWWAGPKTRTSAESVECTGLR